jgi:hypothetical protein
MLGKDLMRVLGLIGLRVRIGHVDIAGNKIGALRPKALDEKVAMLFFLGGEVLNLCLGV